MFGKGEPPSLEDVTSEAIRWVVEAAVADGNAIAELADWSKARVVHMTGGLSPELRARIAARYPELQYYEEAGTPHNAPDEGFVDGDFAVSFPRLR